MISITRTDKVNEAKVQRLSKTKEEAIVTINNHIGEIRSRYITVLPAQDMIYMAKENEAKLYLITNDPEDASLLASEVGITAPTLYEVAQTVINLAGLWRSTAAYLEAIRLRTSYDISNCVTIEEVETVVESFNSAISNI